ncbi:hypothetical protein CUTER_08795 [Corynebacterium uterequi]|uniref:Uncharacterized protein n=1 Tax=Corynebacterium uterequi TaxID=1072256 RepID=A0A0G3HEM1_9CORY|nr:hypothetical protein CUTER_08795 [Corynebacterium uterequi]
MSVVEFSSPALRAYRCTCEAGCWECACEDTPGAPGVEVWASPTGGLVVVTRVPGVPRPPRVDSLLGERGWFAVLLEQLASGELVEVYTKVDL